ncbi:ubiquitin-like domain-containing protein [Trichonephila clavata]|uniref:Ubiquitin-like domain-containing protein n=1 Tax=Trichonephila clavata TaxID=2740835 RepID=A0A8X6KY42_TRICU|nr:ubiquitin-like domain-containing protein [Trichonephila clavata]
MSFIEGIGDEVTAFFVILIVIVIATLVTFIGNGSQIYSVSPTHTRTLPAPRELSLQQSPVTQVTSREPPANRIGPVLNPTNHQLPHQNTFSPTVNEASDDIENLNGSAEAEPIETSTEDLESETPTAPVEEDQTENVEEQSTESDSSGIRIRLKYLDDTERTVRSDPFINIADFKRSHFSEDLANNKVVRLIFCGHLLRDNSTLESYRVVDNSVIHVQILQAQTNQNRSQTGPNAELDISNLLWPLINLQYLYYVLILSWLLRD